jgi:hypothetical protein
LNLIWGAAAMGGAEPAEGSDPEGAANPMAAPFDVSDREGEHE